MIDLRKFQQTPDNGTGSGRSPIPTNANNEKCCYATTFK